MTELQKTRALRALSVLLAVIILLCATMSPTASAASSSEYYENAVLFWTNIERARHGLSALKAADVLDSAADTRAAELARSFSHTRPNGSKWHTALSANGISYSSAAENIAAGQSDPCEAVSAWMNSDGHRSNILSGKYTHLGVGYYYSSSSKYSQYWEQLFASASFSGSRGSFYVAPTGVSADKSSLSIPVGGTAQLKGIPTPIYATAEITCVSSNPRVAQITGTQVNVFSVKGVSNGTATLTLKCGGYSCSVRVTVGSGGSANDTFYDVNPASPYYSAILWASRSGVAAGYADGSFRPNASCTKAQALTFLWRAAGSPNVSCANPFSDVSSSSPYYKAILWAYKTGIAGAESGSSFQPNRECPRADMVLYIWRSAGSPKSFNSVGFTDISSLGSDSRQAIRWAVSEGIVTGYSDTSFRPYETCSRAHVVTFLYRYIN